MYINNIGIYYNFFSCLYILLSDFQAKKYADNKRYAVCAHQTNISDNHKCNSIPAVTHIKKGTFT